MRRWHGAPPADEARAALLARALWTCGDAAVPTCRTPSVAPGGGSRAAPPPPPSPPSPPPPPPPSPAPSPPAPPPSGHRLRAAAAAAIASAAAAATAFAGAPARSIAASGATSAGRERDRARHPRLHSLVLKPLRARVGATRRSTVCRALLLPLVFFDLLARARHHLRHVHEGELDGERGGGRRPSGSGRGSSTARRLVVVVVDVGARGARSSR